MLGYFPVPYDDELFYSCIARYAVHTGQIENNKAVLRDVFGSSTASAIPDLPSHLNDLVDSLKSVWKTSASELIVKNTLAPIYFPFLSDQQAKKVAESMASRSGGNIHTRAGITASCIQPPEFFRYCPYCLKEQNVHHGEPFWQRIHQLSGVVFCSKHSCKLVSSTIYFHPKEKHAYHPLSLEKYKDSSQMIELTKQEHRIIDHFSELLASANLEGLGPGRWGRFYKKLAGDIGVMNKSRVLHQEVYMQLYRTWNSTSFSHFLGRPTEDHWLINIFRKHRKSFHPLRHLMVLTALVPEMSISDIIEDVRCITSEPVREMIQLPKEADPVNKKQYRAEWQTFMANYPDYGIKKLRALSGGGRVYAWLYHNDYNWLMNNHPSYDASDKRPSHVDYHVWDETNVLELERLYHRPFKLKKRPRLTRSYLLKQIPRGSSVEKHLNDLPLTKKWLLAHAESLEDYQVFRLRAAHELLIEDNYDVKRWRLLRLANIRKELITDRIEQELQALENLRL